MPDRDCQNQSQGLRGLPQVQRLLEAAEAQGLLARVPRPALTAALRAVLEQARAQHRSGEEALPAAPLLLARAEALLRADQAPVLRRVINATGVVLHTNLGRAPMAAQAAQAAFEAALGYANLEFDLESGRRGERTQGVEPLLCSLTGAEAAMAVNNAAAAVLLAMSGLAGGWEVVVSRGELVEIGGGFRIPDVIGQGGARLVEVGTTNRTRLADYRAAISPDTRVLLKVHQSNFRITGFTAEAGLDQLAALARERGLTLVHDLGGGALSPLAGRREPTVQDSLKAGADLVIFSGDKLMGGPQAGLLVGTRAAVEPLRRHPLLRAVRLDKMALAALEATLRLYGAGGQADASLPVLRMLNQTRVELQARAEALRSRLDELGVAARVGPSEAFAGGGAMPDERLASCAVTLLARDGDAEALARRLRRHRPAVVGRIEHGRLALDMMAVADADLPDIAAAVRASEPAA